MQVIMIMLGNYYQKHAAFFVAKRADVGNGYSQGQDENIVIGNSKK